MNAAHCITPVGTVPTPVPSPADTPGLTGL